MTIKMPEPPKTGDAQKAKLPPMGWLTFTGVQIESGEDAAGVDAVAESTMPTVPAILLTRDTEKKVNDLLAANSTVSAGTFLNVLKANGIKLVESMKRHKKKPLALATLSFKNLPTPKARECESGSTMVAVTRESFHFDRPMLSRLLESRNDGVGPTKFRAILITEGLGNLRDGYWYTREALESAIAVFEGRKAYANHPSRSDEEDRPERDVRDILGFFSNLGVGYADDGRAQLEADFSLPSSESYKWARELITSSIEYRQEFPDKDLVGLSINANGAAERIPVEELVRRGIPDSCKPKLETAILKGLTSVKMVTQITDAVSCDLVTEAGAGGKIVSVIN